MFLGNDIMDFINKIVNSEDTQAQNKLKNIEEFRNYLRLTKMADEETLKCIDKVIECLPEIFKLKLKVGYFDINNILKSEKDSLEHNDQKKAKQRIKLYEEKHYHHYQNASSSSSCGGGATRSGC